MEKEKKVYFILGAKWFDKINGNTYCNAKVLNNNGDLIGYIGYQYGYGSHYYYEAKKIINDEGSKFVDMGAFYINKKDLIKNNF